MAERDLSEILDDCITRLASGQSIDDCLLHYAEHAPDLRPMLEAGLLTRRISINPLEVRQAKDRVRFRLESRRRPSRNRQVWTATSALLAGLVVILVAAIFFAERSLPGDPLYGLKRFSETVRLVVGTGNEADLQEQFAQRRRAEVAQLLALHRAADVTFTGVLQAVNSPNWQVSGLILIVAPTVPGAQAVQVDNHLEVQASTTLEGTLVARSLSVLQRGKPKDPTPLPTATPSAAFTATSQPTATPTTVPSLTPPPTLKPTTAPTIKPSPTTVPTTVPSAKPTIATSPDPVPTRRGNQGPGGSSGSNGSGSSGNSDSGSGSSGGSGGSNDEDGDDDSDGAEDSEDSGSGSDDHGDD